tara:strand:+ start:504 stop:917 length:414 start_codon:yes stop_codon:yes gene_type:complete
MSDKYQTTNNQDIQPGNLPASENPADSQRKVRKFFDNFYQGQLSYPSNEVDAVIGFFEKRGFDKISATSVGSLILQQAKLDDVNVFQLLDTLKGTNDLQLSSVVTELLNYNRQKISTLGFKVDPDTGTWSEKRNIMV